MLVRAVALAGRHCRVYAVARHAVARSAVAALLAGAAFVVAGRRESGRRGRTDWPQFGFDAARHNVGPASTGITAGNVGRLRRQQVQLDGTVDSSPIYLHGVTVGGSGARRLLRHDDLRPDRGDRRRQRQAALALPAADLLELRRLGPDHDDDADRRPRPHRDLRGRPGRAGQEARGRRPARSSGRPRSRATRRTRSSPRR